MLTILLLAILVAPLLFAVSAALFTALVAGLVEAAIAPLGSILTVRGARLRVLDQGRGTPIVMLHGLSGNMRNFTYALADDLARGHRVVVFDRPGNGYSTATPECASLEGQARLIAEAIEALGLRRPLLVGHSLGGTVALAMALERPDLVGGLALLAPLTAATVAMPTGFRLLASPFPFKRRLVAWCVATPMAVLFGGRTRGAVFSPDTPPPDFGSRGGNLLALRPESALTTSAEIVAVGSGLAALQARYGAIACPVGVLFGTEDKALAAEEHIGAILAALPNARIERVAGAGHMTPLTAPRRSLAFIRAMAETTAAPSQPSEPDSSLK